MTALLTPKSHIIAPEVLAWLTRKGYQAFILAAGHRHSQRFTRQLCSGNVIVVSYEKGNVFVTGLSCNSREVCIQIQQLADAADVARMVSDVEAVFP